jgi:hypothetical protein
LAFGVGQADSNKLTLKGLVVPRALLAQEQLATAQRAFQWSFFSSSICDQKKCFRKKSIKCRLTRVSRGRRRARQGRKSSGVGEMEV